MAYITKVRIEAEGESAAEVERILNDATKAINTLDEYSVCCAHQVIEAGIDGFYNPVSNAFKGRRILEKQAFHESEEPNLK